MADTKYDPDAKHDSAALWFERSGRYVRLALEAQSGEESERLLEEAMRFAKEGIRAEKLGRL